MTIINAKTIIAMLLLVAAGALYCFFNQKHDNSDRPSATTTSQSGSTSVAQNTSTPTTRAPLPGTEPTPTTPSPVPQPQDASTSRGTSTADATVAILQGITPQFIDDKEQEGTLLPPALKQIKETAQSILIAQNPGDEERDANMGLLAVGHRYVLVGIPSGTLPRCNHVIIDFLNRKTVAGGGEYCFQTKNAIVYISQREINSYVLDGGSFKVLHEADLPSGETYDAQAGNSYGFGAEETHTDSTLTIAVFDTNTFVKDPNIPVGGQFKKFRDVTISIP